MLLDILMRHNMEIVARARARVAMRGSPRASNEHLVHGVPLFLHQLACILRGSPKDPGVLRETATLHGHELMQAGFSVAQVVHGYGDVCQVVTEVARETGEPVEVGEFSLFNACLDEAIAHALTEYGRQRELQLIAQNNEHIGEFAHEIRNLLSNATLAFDTIREGHAAASGRTAAILGASLRAMRELTDKSLTQVRLEARQHRSQPVGIRELLEELEITAGLEAKAHKVQLAVSPVPGHLYVEGDRALLVSALGNLLQNAMKFTHPGSTVQLRTRHTEREVFLDVEDECGGLPAGKQESMFRPFAQYGYDKSGVGLGLSISRRAAEANGGRLDVRDLPGKGCIFTLTLPRIAAPVH
jgi:signal transduction histidine kinase